MQPAPDFRLLALDLSSSTMLYVMVKKELELDEKKQIYQPEGRVVMRRLKIALEAIIHQLSGPPPPSNKVN